MSLNVVGESVLVKLVDLFLQVLILITYLIISITFNQKKDFLKNYINLLIIYLIEYVDIIDIIM